MHTVHRRPGGRVIREVLSNGQLLTVWFWRLRNKPAEPWAVEWPDTKIAFIWKVAIYIGPKKAADKWANTRYAVRVRKIRQTGECGLEGMRRAMWHVVEHCEAMGMREELHIICEDAKRYRAYRWLIRHFNGFTDFIYDDGDMAIAFRNPRWWSWI